MDLETKRNGIGMEMEIIIRLVWNWGWNGMDCSVEFPVEGNGKGMERNFNFRWN